MSELTVPRAPNIVGRTANEQFEAPEAGAAVAQFGNRMLQFGTALEADRLDRQMSRLRVDMTKDLGELRLQVEEIGDPEAAGAAWDQGIARLRQTYQTGTDERGRPRIDKKNAENFGLAFDDLSNTHALALGGRFLALRQSQRAATYYEYSTVAGDQAAKADPATRDKLYADFDEETDRQVAAGTMDPERAAKAKTEFRQRTENAAAIELQAADPQGLIEALDGDEFANLDPETRARYGVSAQAEVDRRAAADQRAAETAAKEWEAKTGRQLDDLADIYSAGRTPQNAAILADKSLQEHPVLGPKARKALAAEQLATEIPDLAAKTPDELKALIAAEKKRPIRDPWETERLPVLEAQLAVSLDGWKTDPIGFAQKNPDMAVPVLPEFDPSNPDAFVDAVGARVTYGKGLKEKGYVKAAGKAAPFLSREEQASVKAALAVEQDPIARAALGAALFNEVMAMGGDPGQIEALAADPVLSWTAGQMAKKAIVPAIAAEILTGQQVLAAKTVVMPPLEARNGETFAYLGTLFNEMPNGDFRKRQVVDAADALFAARIRELKPGEEIPEGLYKQALHEVYGGTGVAGSADAKGGVQEFRDIPTILEPGMSPAAIEQTFATLVDHMRVETNGNGAEVIAATEALPEVPTSTVLQSVSRSGGVPTSGGEPLEESDFVGGPFKLFEKGLTLKWVGYDSYVLVLDQGTGQMAEDSTRPGTAYVFSLKRLMQEYGQ